MNIVKDIAKKSIIKNKDCKNLEFLNKRYYCDKKIAIGGLSVIYKGIDIYSEYFNKDSNIVDGSWGGECILLTENGCSLEFNERPKGARLLKPQEDMQCQTDYNKEQCVIDWMNYQDVLEKLYIEYYRW